MLCTLFVAYFKQSMRENCMVYAICEFIFLLLISNHVRSECDGVIKLHIIQTHVVKQIPDACDLFSIVWD